MKPKGAEIVQIWIQLDAERKKEYRECVITWPYLSNKMARVLKISKLKYFGQKGPQSFMPVPFCFSKN